ncbi:MAG: PIN domain-containing protein, partial [Chloroflexota bacterium]
LYSARSAAHLTGLRQELALALESIAMQESDFERAADVLGALADRGQSRAARLPDLLLAAVAERAGLTILHYDEDFDRIAAVTDQAAQWVVPRGSI